ncbi:MAG: GNAT family N-acetyltransferase [Gammaproteobacteria bacterium]
MEFAVRAARRDDLPALPAIELAAATLLLEYAPQLDLSYITPADEFVEAMEAGLLWVAEADDRPVGFGLVEMLDGGQPHFEELDVLPQYQRRGIGSELIREICRWFMSSSYRELTLTTFRHVPWNAAFYARLGFELVPPSGYSDEIRRLVQQESHFGLDPELRVVMRYNPEFQ